MRLESRSIDANSTLFCTKSLIYGRWTCICRLKKFINMWIIVSDCAKCIVSFYDRLFREKYSKLILEDETQIKINSLVYFVVLRLEISF